MFLDDGRKVTVEEVRRNRSRLLVKFAEIPDRTTAEALHQRYLFVSEGDVPPAPDLARLPDLDREVITRALKLDSHDRWPSCTEMLLALEGTSPELNQQLLDLNLLDEVFWTIAPKLAGGCGPNLLTGHDQARAIRARLDLLSLFEQDSELFARYRVRRGSPA